MRQVEISKTGLAIFDPQNTLAIKCEFDKLQEAIKIAMRMRPDRIVIAYIDYLDEKEK